MRLPKIKALFHHMNTQRNGQFHVFCPRPRIEAIRKQPHVIPTARVRLVTLNTITK